MSKFEKNAGLPKRGQQRNSGPNDEADSHHESGSNEERKRVTELHQESERMKLRVLQADAGLINSKDLRIAAERMDWMYANPADVKREQDQEACLLGQQPKLDDAERAEMKRRLGVGGTWGGSLFLSSVTAQGDDTMRKLREDPLLVMRQAELKWKQRDAALQRLLEKRKAQASSSRSQSCSSSSTDSDSSSSSAVRSLGHETRKYSDRYRQDRSRYSRSHHSRSHHSRSRYSRSHCSSEVGDLRNSRRRSRTPPRTSSSSQRRHVYRT